MSFEDFNGVGFHFVGNCHCPYCKTGLIMIDNKPVSCPVCELRMLKDSYASKKRIQISQSII